MSAGDETGKDGFILISVLVVTMLFVTVSATMVTRSRVFVLQERNRMESAALQAKVDGVARLAAFDIMRERFPLPTTGVTGACRNGDMEISVSAIDQEMLLDLNGAPPQMITDVLTAIGISETEAKIIAAQIVDYRDPDDLTQPLYGAEAMEYQRAGLGWRPRNSYFVDATEFSQIPAATGEVTARLAPLMTVDNPRAAIDPAVLYRLYGRSPTMEKALQRWVVKSRVERLALRVEARVKGRAITSRLAVFSVLGSGGVPKFLKWARYEIGRAADSGMDEVDNPNRPEVCAWLAASEAKQVR